jgi:hypothetical protein
MIFKYSNVKRYLQNVVFQFLIDYRFSNSFKAAENFSII